MSVDSFVGVDEFPDFDEHDFNSGREKRLPVVLLLDVSGSMGNRRGKTVQPIDQLNHAIDQWVTELWGDVALRYKAEVAVITFGTGGVSLLGERSSPFTPAATLKVPKFAAGGFTPLVDALTLATEIVEERKAQLDELGISRNMALMFLVTDGQPSIDGSTLDARWVESASAMRQHVENHEFFLTAFGTDDADFAILGAYAPDLAFPIDSTDFLAVLRIVSASARSSNPVEELRRKLQRLGSS